MIGHQCTIGYKVTGRGVWHIQHSLHLIDNDLRRFASFCRIVYLGNTMPSKQEGTYAHT